MGLFRRRVRERDDPAGSTSAPPSWSQQLGAIGAALDGTDQEMCDVAVVVHGGPGEGDAQISLLERRESLFRGVWVSVTYRLDSGARELVDHGTGLPVVTRAALYPGLPGPWSGRLRSIGALIDERRPDLRSPTIIDLPGGAVICGIAPARERPMRKALTTFELSNDEISAARLQEATATALRASPPRHR